MQSFWAALSDLASVSTVRRRKRLRHRPYFTAMVATGLICPAILIATGT
jgi:hypothetical protein